MALLSIFERPSNICVNCSVDEQAVAPILRMGPDHRVQAPGAASPAARRSSRSRPARRLRRRTHGSKVDGNQRVAHLADRFGQTIVASCRLAHIVSPPTSGASSIIKDEARGGVSRKVISVCHQLARSKRLSMASTFLLPRSPGSPDGLR